MAACAAARRCLTASQSILEAIYALPAQHGDDSCKPPRCEPIRFGKDFILRQFLEQDPGIIEMGSGLPAPVLGKTQAAQRKMGEDEIRIEIERLSELPFPLADSSHLVQDAGE